MGTLTMSDKERRRVGIMASVKSQEMTLVEAAMILGLCYRQAKRVWRRYQDRGDAGLVHGLRGKPGQRGKAPELRNKILARYEERYSDFGPTLAAEYLEEEKLVVDHETLRRWLLAANKRTVRRRRQRHRQWRERKPCFGAMVQLDGSHHDWFEGRREKCVLMVMVDDATNRVWAQFFEEETTRASYDVLEGWVCKHGLPQSLYVDRDSIYRCEGLGSIAEQIAGQKPQTQFGRAMKQLGVELILANSPQAKGRVERTNGVLQDRLVKDLRLVGINDIEKANAYLRRAYLPKHNRKFQVRPASQADAHQGAARNLNERLSWEFERVVQRDWTVACEGKWYQLDKGHESMSLAGKRVTVRRLRNGAVQVERGGMKLRWRELPTRPARVTATPSGRLRAPRKSPKPAMDHAWRSQQIGSVRRAMKRRREAASGGGDSGRPPLRSGLPASPPPEAGEKNNRTKGTLSPEFLRGHF